jgi:hypothetical protein
VRSLVCGVVALTWLAAAGCSGGESESYPWPEVHGYDVFEGATSESVIDALVLGADRAFGDEYAVEHTAIYTLDDVEDRDRLQADYESRLQSWDDVDPPGRSSTGRGWERGDQRFTLVFVTLDDQRLAVTLATRRR